MFSRNISVFSSPGPKIAQGFIEKLKTIHRMTFIVVKIVWTIYEK